MLSDVNWFSNDSSQINYHSRIVLTWALDVIFNNCFIAFTGRPLPNSVFGEQNTLFTGRPLPNSVFGEQNTLLRLECYLCADDHNKINTKK